MFSQTLKKKNKKPQYFGKMARERIAIYKSITMQIIKPFKMFHHA